MTQSEPKTVKEVRSLLKQNVKVLILNAEPGHYDTLFENLEMRFLSFLKFKFIQKLNLARHKDMVFKKMLEDNLIQYLLCFNPDEYERRHRFIKSFQTLYEYGDSLYELLQEIQTYREDLLGSALKDLKGVKDIYDDIILGYNDHQLVSYFAKLAAYQHFLSLLEEQYPELFKQFEEEFHSFGEFQYYSPRPFIRKFMLPIPFKNEAKWNNKVNEAITKRDNEGAIRWAGKFKIDFVKLVYALYEGGYIDNNGRGITHAVNELDRLFGPGLAKSWQSSLSKQKTKSNNDFDPLEFFNDLSKFFASLKESYSNYLSNSIKEK